MPLSQEQQIYAAIDVYVSGWMYDICSTYMYAFTQHETQNRYVYVGQMSKFGWGYV